MKLNYDLIRELLLFIEDHTDGSLPIPDNTIVQAFAANSEQNVVIYHLKYLMDTGFIERAYTAYLKSGFTADITPTGRNYLDSIRDERRWDDVKKHFADKLGNVAIDIVSLVARKCMLDAIGLVP